jgi:hypothetical protein
MALHQPSPRRQCSGVHPSTFARAAALQHCSWVWSQLGTPCAAGLTSARWSRWWRRRTRQTTARLRASAPPPPLTACTSGKCGSQRGTSESVGHSGSRGVQVQGSEWRVRHHCHRPCVHLGGSHDVPVRSSRDGNPGVRTWVCAGSCIGHKLETTLNCAEFPMAGRARAARRRTSRRRRSCCTGRAGK